MQRCTASPLSTRLRAEGDRGLSGPDNLFYRNLTNSRSRPVTLISPPALRSTFSTPAVLPDPSLILYASHQCRLAACSLTFNIQHAAKQPAPGQVGKHAFTHPTTFPFPPLPSFSASVLPYLFSLDQCHHNVLPTPHAPHDHSSHHRDKPGLFQIKKEVGK